VKTAINFQLYTDVTHLFKTVNFKHPPLPHPLIHRPHDAHRITAPYQGMKCGLSTKSSAALQEQENDLVSEEPNTYPPIYNGRNIKRLPHLSLFSWMPKQSLHTNS